MNELWYNINQHLTIGIICRCEFVTCQPLQDGNTLEALEVVNKNIGDPEIVEELEAHRVPRFLGNRPFKHHFQLTLSPQMPPPISILKLSENKLYPINIKQSLYFAEKFKLLQKIIFLVSKYGIGICEYSKLLFALVTSSTVLLVSIRPSCHITEKYLRGGLVGFAIFCLS